LPFKRGPTTAIKAGLTFALISWATSPARFSIDTAATKRSGAVNQAVAEVDTGFCLCGFHFKTVYHFFFADLWCKDFKKLF
jgi:hypothetical protein